MKSEKGTIYYHGTNEKSASDILKKGFKKGTYFTWDLHSALVMGGFYIFGVFMKELDHTKYWEYILPEKISKNEILFLRKFNIESIHENIKNDKKIHLHSFFKEWYGKNIIFCRNCSGRGQMNNFETYRGWKNEKKKIIVCNVCKGFGCYKPNGYRINGEKIKND